MNGPYMNGPCMTDIRWMNSSRRMDCLNELVVDGAIVDEPRVDGPKKPRGT